MNPAYKTVWVMICHNFIKSTTVLIKINLFQGGEAAEAVGSITIESVPPPPRRSMLEESDDDEESDEEEVNNMFKFDAEIMNPV